MKEERQETDQDRSTAESTVSEVSIPEEVSQMCTTHAFDSDRTTVSDVAEGDDDDFSQRTDSVDDLMASFNLATENSAGVDVNQNSCETDETRSLLDCPVTTARRNEAGILAAGNTASPSAAKRHLESTFDTSLEPSSSRRRRIVEAAVVDVQSEVSPLRKALTSKLSL